jgi:formamidopyrimidine-DNA glycosylase
MPELPEVETIVRDLRKQGLPGARITEAAVYWPRTVATHASADFIQALRGVTVESLERRGKFLVFHLSGSKKLLIHLRMSGRLLFAKPQQPRAKHEHILLTLHDGRQLRFQDPRKFGRWYLFAGHTSKLDALGPEPLDRRFNARYLYERLRSRSRQLKALLLDQTFLAGLGNIYVDEALWESRLHPALSSQRLTWDQARGLHRAIVKVLKAGIRHCGTSLGKSDFNYYSTSGRRGRHQDALQIFRRTGQPCPRCRQKILRLVIAQRGSHICPRCQRQAVSSK